MLIVIDIDFEILMTEYYKCENPQIFRVILATGKRLEESMERCLEIIFVLYY